MAENTKTEGQEGQEEPDHIRDLREKAQREAAVSRENKFLRALGPDLVDTPAGQMFMKSYDGELDPTVIRTEWDKVLTGISAITGNQTSQEGAGSQQSTTEYTNAEGQGAPPKGGSISEAIEEVSTEYTGGAPSQQGEPDYEKQGLEEYHRQKQAGGRQEDAFRAGLAGIIASQPHKKINPDTGEAA